MLHQTPRSGDEFTEVIELLGDHHRLIALDLPSMGHSSPHPNGDTIAAYAHGIDAALTTLASENYVLVGHHTGAAVAAQLAASQPARIASLVLSSPPWIDAAARAQRLARPGPGIDDVQDSDDGSHLVALWAGRAPFYPARRPDLLVRFVADALLVKDPAAGHRAVTHWDMTSCLPALNTVPTTLVDHVDDPHAHPNIATWSEALPYANVVRIEQGVVPLEFTAPDFAATLHGTLPTS